MRLTISFKSMPTNDLKQALEVIFNRLVNEGEYETAKLTGLSISDKIKGVKGQVWIKYTLNPKE